MILLRGIFAFYSLIFATIAAAYIDVPVYDYRQAEMRQVLESLPKVKKLHQFTYYERVNIVDLESVDGFRVKLEFSDSNGRFGRPENLQLITLDGRSPRCENAITYEQINIVDYINHKQQELRVHDFQSVITKIPQVIAFMNENYGSSYQESKMLAHQGETYACYIE